MKITRRSFHLGIAALLLAAPAIDAQQAQDATRDVTEFMLFKQDNPVAVAGVPIRLRGTDVNKQRYKIEIELNGRKIEFKDLNAMVPLYFYTSAGQQQPHELVVMRVAKDQIDGRISRPPSAAN